MRCINCSKEISSDSNACRFCGQPILHAPDPSAPLTIQLKHTQAVVEQLQRRLDQVEDKMQLTPNHLQRYHVFWDTEIPFRDLTWFFIKLFLALAIASSVVFLFALLVWVVLVALGFNVALQVVPSW